MGEKWQFWAQYWGTDTDGGYQLEEPLEWGDIVFKPGSFVAGGISMDVTRLFFGRVFSSSSQHEFGVGAGVHWLDLETYIEGAVIVGDDDDIFEFCEEVVGEDICNSSATTDFPMPNIGAWYLYSWSPKWMFQARVDWLSASIGDYSGGIWDIQGGVNYQAFKHVGFGLYYKWFKLNGNLNDEGWNGAIDFKQSGPVLTVTASW